VSSFSPKIDTCIGIFVYSFLQPSVLPIQILRIGQFIILSVPGGV
jgi:hypothetical protein